MSSSPVRQSRSSKATYKRQPSKTSAGSNGSYAGFKDGRASQRLHTSSRMGGSQMRSSRLGATQAGGGTNDHRVYDEEGKERTPKPMLSLRPNNMRPLPSLIGESQASVTSDTDRGSMMSEMGHLERLSSAAFSTGSSRMSAGYGSSTLTPELSMGSQMGISVSAMAGLEHKVASAQ
ncbi:TPA: hypothetical protein ACH3X3_005626 [Trebouxia sp. C0006]